MAPNVVLRPVAAQSLRGSALVVLEQPAEPRPAPDHYGTQVGRLQWRIVASAQRSVAQPLVRTELVVIAGVLLHNVIQVSQCEAQEGVKAFSLQTTDPGLDEAIRDGSPWV